MTWRRVRLIAVAVVLGVTAGAVMLVGTVARDPVLPPRPPGPPGPTGTPTPRIETTPDPAAMKLVTNEHAFRPGGKASQQWLVTSGSLFGSGPFLWSGIPDGEAPGPTSRTRTGSAVLRAVTVDDTYTGVDISFDLQVNDRVRTSRTPSKAYDGVHVSLRYQDERHGYYVSVDRRDGALAIKKKLPGGPSNGGTYTTLAKGEPPTPKGRQPDWRHVEVSIAGVTDITIELRIDGRRALTATEKPTDKPIVSPGRVGIRGDNCNFYLRNFRVTRRST